MRITLLDPSVGTSNLGDQIIIEAARDQLNKIFADAFIINTPTHEKISTISYRMNSRSDFSFLGGTNLLSSKMNFYNQWKINLLDALFLNNITLMGVGWWQYQNNPNFYTKTLLKSVLHRDLLHSVRDSYTEEKLRSAGFKNVVNTACPTMWLLDESHCGEIPNGKGEAVVTTLTDYNKNHSSDFSLIQILKKAYKNVYIWPQGSGDLKYIHELELEKAVTILPPNLKAFDELLEKSISLDFVGTRLHAGIRALQKKRRSIILGIDNRALEKARDFNLPVCPRGDIDALRTIIESKMVTKIDLPNKNIDRWKSQFK